MLRRFLILIIVFISFFAQSAFAQVQNSDITLSISPSNPKANQNIEAKVTSYILDTKGSYFTWKVNEETKSTGIGKSTFSFTLGSLNSQTNLSVNITTTDGKTLTQSMTLYGADIDMLWEAIDSYAPPFYRGKTLFAKEGEVKVVAIPSVYSGNQKVSPNTLSYVWEKDGNGQQGASGFGKNFFVYKNSFLDNFNEVQVSVSDINKQVNTTGKINISPYTPKILFYKKDISGIKTEKVIGNDYFIKPEGENIFVAPYFFSPKNLNSQDLEIKWFVNGKQILSSVFKNELYVTPEKEQTGSANIKVIINNLQTLYQSLEKGINVNF